MTNMVRTEEEKLAIVTNQLAILTRRSDADEKIQELFEEGRCTQTTRKRLIEAGLATKAQANAYIRTFRKKMGLYAKGSGKHFNKSKKMKEVFA